MKRTWIKLYIEILDDAEFGELPEFIKWRAIELFLVAGENGDDGLLPPVSRLAWRLRLLPEKIAETLSALSQVGVVHETPEGWMVTNFKKRQYSESYERVKRYRNARSNGDCNAVVAEKESSSTSTSASDSSSGSVLEREGAGEETIPTSPKEAASHPDIIAFQDASGRFPGFRDYALVIETIQFLRGKHGAGLVDYLKPYWLAWSGRRRRSDGQPYDPASLTWLTEWAVNGTIPPENGSKPPRASQTDEERQAILRKVAQDAFGK